MYSLVKNSVPQVEIVSCSVPTTDDRESLLQEFLNSKNFSRNTRKAYERELRRFLAWSDVDWQSVSSLHLSCYCNWLRDDARSERTGETLSPATINQAIVALKSFYSWFELPHNPAQKIKLMKEPEPTDQKLSPQEMEAIWDAIEYLGETQIRDRALIWLLYHGLRAGEVVLLNVGDYQVRTLRVTAQKTKDRRAVPLKAEAQSAIQEYLTTRGDLTPDSPLIASVKGTRLSYWGIYETVDRIRSLTGIYELHPHRFRHTFASETVRQIDPVHVRKILGHRSDKTLRRYIKGVEEDAAIDAFFEKNEG